MFAKKVFVRCPKCRSRLNPRYAIGAIGLCNCCGWAGSFHSHNYDDWVQFKVSAILIFLGMLTSLKILTMTPTDHLTAVKAQPATVQRIVNKKPPVVASKRVSVHKKRSFKNPRTSLY